MQEQTNLLDEMASDAQEATERAPTETVVELGREMADLKDRLDKVKAEKKELQEEYDLIRKRKLPEAMEAAGLVSDAGKGSFTLADGRKAHLRTEFRAYVRKADRERVYAWLRDSGMGDLIQETVHHNTLTAFAREQTEEGNELPEEIQTYEDTVAVVTKS